MVLSCVNGIELCCVIGKSCFFNHLGAKEDDKFEGARDPGVLGLGGHLHLYFYLYF